jgi:hypothetical protein
MTVRAQQRVTRNPESLQVNLVTDSIARAGKDNAILGRKGFEESVVITVLEAGLEGVVVHITD